METSNHKAESIEKCLGNIHETFNPGKKCLGKDWRIIFNENELISFISNLTEKEREALSHLVAFFYYKMRPLHKLIEKDHSINDFLGPIAWSDFALVVIMSIFDKYTKKIPRIEFIDLLEANLPITSAEQLKKLAEEQKKTNPPAMVKRLTELFTKNLESKEINNIIENYMAEDQAAGQVAVSSIEGVFKHLWGSVRSGFIHHTGSLSIYNESTIFRSTGPNTATVSNNLSMSHLLFLSWKVIFRDLGYQGELNSNFTEEERANGLSVDGSKL